ncbi:MAG: GxxExxY protein [Saprospiraceae bacterium]|jgi:GxxExxY protein
MTQKEVNDLSYHIVGCAIEVHKILGPGLLEAVYEACMLLELRNAGLEAARQVHIPIVYKGTPLIHPLKIDLLVNNLIIVELKSVESILPVFKAQLLSYMALAQKPKGLLINFNTDNIVKSTVPLVNTLFSNLPKS